MQAPSAVPARGKVKGTTNIFLVLTLLDTSHDPVPFVPSSVLWSSLSHFTGVKTEVKRGGGNWVSHTVSHRRC